MMSTKQKIKKKLLSLLKTMAAFQRGYSSDVSDKLWVCHQGVHLTWQSIRTSKKPPYSYNLNPVSLKKKGERQFLRMRRCEVVAQPLRPNLPLWTNQLEYLHSTLFSEIGDPAAGTIEVRESFKDILEEPEVFETLFVLKVINIERAPCPFIRRGGRSVIVNCERT